MTYDPDWDGPQELASFRDLDGSSGLVDRRIGFQDGKPVTLRWRTSGPKRFFQRCDVAEFVKDSLVSNCTFDRCRFYGSRWEDVKFSNCVFESCDFSGVNFLRCYFVSDCAFRNNSASAELFRIDDTAISSAAFIRGLSTNLKHAPNVAYQKHRFVGTRQKIAKALFSATRNEPDVNYYFEAYEQVVRCSLEQRVEQHRFRSAADVRPVLQFVFMSAPARVERLIVLLSGWLTEWGRSLLRPFGFFTATVLLFTAVYLSTDTSSGVSALARFADCVVKALNITLVAGYTAHFDPRATVIQKLVVVTNVVVGIFWYSLIVPVLSRRVLR